MSTYAKIEENIVVNVIEADADFIATISGDWVETMSSHRGGVDYNPDSFDGIPQSQHPLYAAKGFIYDSNTNLFKKPPLPDGEVGVYETDPLILAEAAGVSIEVLP